MKIHILKFFKYVRLLTWLLFYSNIYAQHCSESPTTITTDWRVPVQDYSGNYYNLNTWDWTQMHYDNEVYYTSKVLGEHPGWTNPMTIPAPWDVPSSLDHNTYDFWNNWNYYGIDAVDCHPEDGWELLYKNFGYASDPCGSGNTGDAIAVDNPFFALYNRYTSKVRVFLFEVMTGQTTNTGASVQISFISTIHPATLAPATAIMKPISAFDKSLTQTVPNEFFTTITEFWLYAEFPVTYDPCTCNYPSTMQFAFNVLNAESVDLTGDGTSSLTQIVTPSGVPSAGTGLQAVLSNTSAALSAGNKDYSTIST